jgi:hypothetical protein
MLISAKEFITLALCHFYFYAAKLSVLTTWLSHVPSFHHHSIDVRLSAFPFVMNSIRRVCFVAVA